MTRRAASLVRPASVAKLALVAGSALALAWWLEQRRIAALRRRLLAPGAHQRISHEPDLSACPPVVARYLRFALAGSVGRPAAVELHQSGALRTDTTSRRWLPFEAVHRAAVAQPGFLWDARVTVAPAVHVRVLDSLADGAGAGKVLLQSIIPLAGRTGRHEMNAGCLHRFLAEAVWYPWVLLPGEHLAWRAVADDRAMATLTSGESSVSLIFRFAPGGEVTGIFTPARWGNFSGRYLQLPWEGHFGDYVDRGGIRVPMWGEVGWYRRGALEIVWRGRIRAYRVMWDGITGPNQQRPR